MNKTRYIFRLSVQNRFLENRLIKDEPPSHERINPTAPYRIHSWWFGKSVNPLMIKGEISDLMINVDAA